MISNLRTMPVVRSLPIVGSTLDFLSNPDGFLVRSAAELGSVFEMRFLGSGLRVRFHAR